MLWPKSTGNGALSFLTKTDSVAEQLRSEILSGEMTPGTTLKQAGLARRLGVSATPVREAFAVLETEGLLRRQRHHGVVVAQRDISDLTNVFQMRTTLELQALRLAFPQINDKVMALLSASIQDAKRAAEIPVVHSFRSANTSFHEILADASGSPVYSEITRLLIRRTLFAVPLTNQALREVLKDHKSIMESLAERNFRSAERLMKEHLRRITTVISEAAKRGKAAGSTRSVQ